MAQHVQKQWRTVGSKLQALKTYINYMKTITTKDEARQYAIDWQQKTSKKSISQNELAEDMAILEDLAKEFDLVEEFTDNGII
jgi:peptidyl-tRNA hydrolase